MLARSSTTTVRRPRTGTSKSRYTIDHAAELIRLASNPDRLKILLLLECEDRSVSGLITEFPGQSDQYISRHLGHLRRGGLVEDWVAGQFRIYALTETGRALLRAIGKASGW